MKSKTKISKQLKKKTNPELVKTVGLAKKNEKWVGVAGALSGPRRNRLSVNLNEINQKVKEGGKVVVPGKVLSQGEIDKKIKVVALSFSEKARDKLKKAGCEVLMMSEEIKKNPGMKGVEIFKNAKSKDFTLSKLNKKQNLNK